MTLKLDEDLHRRLKERAAREGRTLQSLANDLLRLGLAVPKASDYRLKFVSVKGEHQPGVDLFDRDALFNLMEER